jgi:hypothetical protein
MSYFTTAYIFEDASLNEDGCIASPFGGLPKDIGSGSLSMYSSLLVMGVPLVADYFSWLRLLALLGLAAHYPQYAVYMIHIKRLIPSLW